MSDVNVVLLALYTICLMAGFPPKKVQSYACNYKWFIWEVILGYTNGRADKEVSEAGEGALMNR